MHFWSTVNYLHAGLLPLAFAHPSHGVPAASLMSTRDVPKLVRGQVPYGSIITACTVPGNVALTYDDGPGLYTEELLDILDNNKVKATFFILGNAATGPITGPKNSKIIQRMHSSGHHIASHTWSHPDLAFIATEERRQEMEKTEQAFLDVLGLAPTYMRPPYASCPEDCVEDMANFGYHVVNMNVDTKDYLRDYDFAREVYNSALSSRDPKEGGFIVLSHDIHPDTVKTLTQYMIDTANTLGYNLVTLGECLGDPAQNWYRK